jgi:hypothetical protein
MLRRDEGPCQKRFSAFLVLSLFLRVEKVFAADGREPDVDGPVEVARASALPAIVVRAVQLAAARLAGPGCREVLSDFRDGRGHTMQQNLDALGVSGARYLQWTLFYDGTGKPICERREVLAATAPGSRAIFVCVAQFSHLAQGEPGVAAALIIHEELHSLGLGENPPDSRAITAQVIARCGK